MKTKRPPPDSTDPNSADPDKPKPRAWWQWFLLYPTLAISVLSAVPTYIELVGSKFLGVPFGNYRIAVRENELWKENVNCAAAPFDGLKTKQLIEVDAVVCLSGNVLVRVNPPGSKTAYKWVPLDSVGANRTGGMGLVSAAYAAPVPLQRQAGEMVAQGGYQVICQHWVGNGMIRRVILNRGVNACFAEVVNTFNGQVVSSGPSRCSC